MGFHLKQNDYLVMGLLAALSGIAGYTSLMATEPVLVEKWLDRGTILVVLFSILIIYKAKQEVEGDLVRDLELIGIGLAIYMFIYLPHIIWHITGQNPVEIGSVMIPANFLFGFFHALTISSFILIGYGFYNLWVNQRDE